MYESGNEEFDPHETINSASFDFEYWAELHKRSPKEFEEKRAILMETYVENIAEHHQRRAKGILFQIDAIRRNPNTPIKNCIEISKMMWDSLLEMQNILSSPETLTPLEMHPKADILKFKQRE